jgi:hypothetical protein
MAVEALEVAGRSIWTPAIALREASMGFVRRALWDLDHRQPLREGGV